MKLVFKWVAGSALVLLFCVELGLRVFGLLDFPLYRPGPPFGYIPAPSQSGAFLNRNDYAFNSRSMGVAAEFVPKPNVQDTLLVGDSIVYGGNRYRQSEKLGPQLQGKIGGKVWPIGAGSWSLSNELLYLEINPDIARKSDKVVFVLNSGDLQAPSEWKLESTHPTHRPLLAIQHLAVKTLHIGVRGSPGPALDRNWKEQWVAFHCGRHPPTLIVLYPNKVEASDGNLRLNALLKPMQVLSGAGLVFVDVGADSRWNTSLYRDDIHPTPKGTEVLATIIGEAIKRES
ncbi:SGNH/GDSL hydrolase family protein [Caulobacter henricii]|uniref:SGNH/GDSL hydrolase family protein n=1 Tax=Caulobacter henricii TaxID=69395 RepID=UPI000A652C40|nr:SGNH/GDSL hydrolase family protein [Caulobacter henricii]